MKAKLIVVILSIAALLVLVACSFIPPKDISVNDSYSGKEVKVAQYGTLTITLESDPVLWASWSEKAKVEDYTVITQTSHKYIPPDAMEAGVPSHDVWTFNAISAGQSKIYLEYRQPYETAGPPVKDFDLTVIVMKQWAWKDSTQYSIYSTTVTADLLFFKDAVINVPNLEQFIKDMQDKLPLLDHEGKRLALYMEGIMVYLDADNVEIMGFICPEDCSIVFKSSQYFYSGISSN